tara:strand:- start:96 stop:257 length:162 start_codon:yes stop_codon:yes gene_type:complete
MKYVISAVLCAADVICTGIDIRRPVAEVTTLVAIQSRMLGDFCDLAPKWNILA